MSAPSLGYRCGLATKKYTHENKTSMKKCAKNQFLFGNAWTCRQHCLYEQQKHSWFVHFNSCESQRKIQLKLSKPRRGNLKHFGCCGWFALSCGACFLKTTLREMSGGKQKRARSATTLRSYSAFRWNPKCLSKPPWNIYVDSSCGYSL